MFDIALGIFLFLSPIIFLFGQNARLNGTVMALQFYQFKTLSTANNIIQLQFFQYGIVALFIIALIQKSSRGFQDKYLAGFLGICALSVVLHPKTLPAFMPVFLGIMLYCLVVQYSRNIRKLLYVIAAVSVLNTLFALLQSFGIYWFYNPPEHGNICGMMFSPSHLGIYQALAFPICYAINPLLSIIALIGMILSRSFTPLFALLAGVIYLLFPKKNKIFVNFAPIGLTAFLGLFILIAMRSYKFILFKLTLKLGLWLAVLKEVIQHPLGVGLLTFSQLSEKIYSKSGHWNWIYNEYLSAAFYLGLPSLFFIFMFLKDKFNNTETDLYRTIAASCLIVMVICMAQSPMHFPRLSGTIIPLFGFLGILKRKEFCNEN